MEDLQGSAVQVSYRGAVVTFNVIKSIILKLLEDKPNVEYGEQSLKKLNLQGKQLESVNLSGEDIKNFRKQLNHYNVDFAVVKDKTTGAYNVFFKGQDVDRIYKGLENCIKDLSIDRDSRKPISEVIANSMRKSSDHMHSMAETVDKKDKAHEHE